MIGGTLKFGIFARCMWLSLFPPERSLQTTWIIRDSMGVQQWAGMAGTPMCAHGRTMCLGRGYLPIARLGAAFGFYLSQLAFLSQQ